MKTTHSQKNDNKMMKFADQIDELEMLAYKNTEKSDDFSANQQKYDTAYTLSQQNSGNIETIFGLVEANTANISTNAGNIQTNANNISALQTTVTGKQNSLTAGSNISISGNIISATNTTYSAGSGINISGTTISADTTTLATKTDLQSKQNTLTAGDNITIENNVISSTASGGNFDTTEIENNILAIRNGLSTQSAEISNLRSLLLLALEGINGTEQTFDQTLDHTFDEYDRELYLTASTEITCPSVFVGCRSDLTQTDPSTNEVNQAIFNGLACATIQYQVSAATTCVFNLYDNSNIIATTSKTLTNSNTNQTLSVTLRAQQGFSSSNHNYYIVATTSVANALTITHQNIQIVAPEANVLNKISPFEVSYNYYTNKYYFSDCSTGVAMVAEVDASSFTSMNNVVWTNTGIAAQNYKTCFIGATDNTTSQIGKKYAIITLKNNRVRIFDCDTPTTFYDFPEGTFSVSAMPTKHNWHMLYYLCCVKNSVSGTYYCLNQDLTFKKQSSISCLSNLANIESHRNNLAYLGYSSSYLANYCTYRNGNGYFNVNYSNTTSYCVINGIQKYHIYMKTVNTSASFDYYLIYQQNNLFYIRQIKYNGSSTNFTTTPVLIGAYDDVFLGKNNNTLFAVENGTLTYLGSL